MALCANSYENSMQQKWSPVCLSVPLPLSFPPVCVCVCVHVGGNVCVFLCVHICAYACSCGGQRSPSTVIPWPPPTYKKAHICLDNFIHVCNTLWSYSPTPQSHFHLPTLPPSPPPSSHTICVSVFKWLYLS